VAQPGRGDLGPLAGLLLGEEVPWSMIAVSALVVLCFAGAKRFG